MFWRGCSQGVGEVVVVFFGGMSGEEGGFGVFLWWRWCGACGGEIIRACGSSFLKFVTCVSFVSLFAGKFFSFCRVPLLVVTNTSHV